MILDVTLKLPNGDTLKLTVTEWRALQTQLNSLFPIVGGVAYQLNKNPPWTVTV